MIHLLGGRGFVGSGIRRLLEARGLEHRVIDRSNFDSFRGAHCDIFINAAGNSRKPLADQDPLADFEATVGLGVRTLHGMNSDRYILCSSCDVYSDCSSPTVSREDQPLDWVGQSRYGFHKQLLEQMVRRERPRHLILRFGGFIGPGMRKNAIFDILQGGTLWLHPDSRLQFLHTDTAAALVWRLVEGGCWSQTFNICGAGTIALHQVIAASGQRPLVRPDARTVVYDVAIDKLQDTVGKVPDTTGAVLDFVSSLKGRLA